MQPCEQSFNRTPSDVAEPREFTATVTEIRELCRIDGKPLFQLALDRSGFAETGSATDGLTGHPVGTLTAVSRAGAVLVATVLGVARDSTGELWHTVAKPLQQGTSVTGCVEFLRRP